LKYERVGEALRTPADGAGPRLTADEIVALHHLTWFPGLVVALEDPQFHLAYATAVMQLRNELMR
jgi:hypothetical protein